MKIPMPQTRNQLIVSSLLLIGCVFLFNMLISTFIIIYFSSKSQHWIFHNTMFLLNFTIIMSWIWYIRNCPWLKVNKNEVKQ